MAIEGYRVFDCHVHIQPWGMLKPAVRAKMEAGREDLNEILAFQESPDRFLAWLKSEGIDRAALINYVAPVVMGFGPGVNEWISTYCRGRPELLPVGSVHPRLVENAVDAMDELVQKLGIRAIKIHPSHQLLFPHAYLEGDHKLRDVYEEAEGHGIPVVFHTGTSVFPGARNRYADPIFLDDVAVDFPDLTLVLAHAGRPLWMDTCFFLARRHKHVYLDLSGIPPAKLLEYLPRAEEIADRLLFGTDWPSPGVRSIRANVERFLGLPLSEETKRMALWDNAVRVFGDGR